MKRILTLTTLASLVFTAALSATGASAYSINGDSDNGFILKCNDGTTNTSSMPPNHNTATAFCADHGGVAAGYPKKIIKAQKTSRLAPSTGTTGGATNATDYNSSRSNKSY